MGLPNFRILFSVIIPNIRSGILVLVSLLLINSLKVFDIVWIVTRGGPGIATDVLATNMIVTAYDQRLMSAGAAIGVIIFLIAFILVIPYTHLRPQEVVRMKSKSTTLKIVVIVVLVMLTCRLSLADLCDGHQLPEDPAGDPAANLHGISRSRRNFKITRLRCSAAADFLIPMGRPIINSAIITVRDAVGVLSSAAGGLLSQPDQRRPFARMIFILVGIALYYALPGGDHPA